MNVHEERAWKLLKSSKKPSSKLRVVWDVFAHFPCNSCGVRVAVRRSRDAAIRFMDRFARLNRVGTSARFRLEGGIQ